MSGGLVDRVEASHFWFLGRLFIPSRVRRRACEARGAHHPVLVDLGRRKICFSCGTW